MLLKSLNLGYHKWVSVFLTLLLSFQIISGIILFIPPPRQADASSITWNFSNSSDYIFDDTKIEFSAGQAQLKVTSSPAWFDVSWKYRKKITIDHTKVSADLMDFPILISRIDSDWKDTGNGGYVGQSDGGDFVFTSSDGTTTLNYEIEKYTNTSGELVAWVKLPAISSISDTDVYIYYGNSSVVDQQNITNVWDSNYAMVQHLKDTTTSSITDSTANANNGTKKASNEPVETAGKINKSQSFDDIDDYIALPKIGMSEFNQVAQSPDLGIHQGIATDGIYYYLFHTSFIKKTDLNWNQVAINNSVNTESGSGHVGDGSYYNGKLYVPTDNWTSCSSFNPVKISIWNASDLSFVETRDISAQGHEASSVYVDGDTGILYVSSYCDGSKIWKYSLTDLSYIGSISLSSSLVNAQGIAKNGNYFYISAGGTNVYKVALDGTVQGIIYTGINEGIDYYQGNLYGLNDAGSGNSFVYTLAQRSSKAVTVSMWVNIPYLPSEITNSFMRFAWTDDDSFAVFYRKSPAQLEFKLTTTQGNNPRPIVLQAQLVKDQWVYISAVYDGLNAQIYVNGVLKNSIVRDGTYLSSTWNWYIGSNVATTSFNGSVDEVRISSIARSIEWLSTEYNNQNSPSTFYSVDSQIVPYDTNTPTIQPLITQGFTSLWGFTETATKNGGEIKYQISNDAGSTWYWYNSGWTTTASGYSEANTATDINENISSFPVGNGSFLFKAYLNSDGGQFVQLNDIDLSYIYDVTAPSAFTLSSPTDNFSVSAMPTFSWNASTDSESGLAKYQLYLDGNLYRDDISSSTTSASPSQPLSCESHTWYVKAVDKAGNSTQSDSTFTFNIVCGIPGQKTIAKPVFTMTTAEIRAKIAEITEAILQLKLLLAEMDKTGKTYSGISSGFTFDKNLEYGQTSDEIKYLQIILKQEVGPPTYPENVSATGWFGSVTKSSVIEFQEKYASEILAPWNLTEGTGFVGRTTLAKLNELLKR